MTEVYFIPSNVKQTISGYLLSSGRKENVREITGLAHLSSNLLHFLPLVTATVMWLENDSPREWKSWRPIHGWFHWPDRSIVLRDRRYRYTYLHHFFKERIQYPLILQGVWALEFYLSSPNRFSNLRSSQLAGSIRTWLSTDFVVPCCLTSCGSISYSLINIYATDAFCHSIGVNISPLKKEMLPIFMFPWLLKNLFINASSCLSKILCSIC